ncbi:hypothetical protein K2X30_06590 [bacterium]|jgi:type II secretory pathway pseudopilin PulG|nr:hypothetical protein [bacterium]
MNFRRLNSNNLREGGTEGFTLIEILISIFLLVLITISISKAINSTFRLRDRLKTQGEFYNEIRLAMGILNRDLTLLYSPQMSLPPDKKTATDPNAPPPVPGTQPAQPVDADFQALLSSDDGRVNDFWGIPVDKTGLKPSRFQGSVDKMSFVTISNMRIYKEAPESEFSKVTYTLEDDRSNPDLQGAKMLVKSYNTHAFEDDDGRKENIRSYPLLRGITKIQFKYCRQKQEFCVESWDSERGDFKATLPTFPEVIQVILEVKGTDQLMFEGTYWMKPEIPLWGIDASS